MRVEIIPGEDTTTLYVRWEIVAEGGEPERLTDLGGPLSLAVAATNYVDVAGKFHEATEVEIPIWPHPGRRNFGQAKFTDYESRRSFIERLQRGVTADAANFVYDVEPGSIDVEGHVIRLDTQTA